MSRLRYAVSPARSHSPLPVGTQPWHGEGFSFLPSRAQLIPARGRNGEIMCGAAARLIPTLSLVEMDGV